MPYARCLKQVRHKKRYGKNGDIAKQRYYQRRHAFSQRLERAADDNGDRRNDKPGAYDAQGDRSLFHCLRSIGKYVHQLLGNRKTEDRAYYHHAQAEQQCYFEYADDPVFSSRAEIIAHKWPDPLYDAADSKIDKRLQFVINAEDQDIDFGKCRKYGVEHRYHKGGQRQI